MTSTVAHTPHPWHWVRMDGDKRNPLWVLTNATHDVILTIKDHEFGPTAQPQADRPLIASAPELLDMLKRLMEWDSYIPLGAELKALIAKAEGRS